MTKSVSLAFAASIASLLFAAGCSSSNSNDSSGGTTTDGGSTAKGPGAAFLCTSSGKDAFDTYGASAFVKVNQSIFANVTAEVTANGTANLGTSFTEIGTGKPASTADSLATFEGKLAAFLVYAYGGPTSIMYTDGVTYDGVQNMSEAHTGLGITSAQYTYFVSNIVVPALTSNGVSSADVSSCFAPVVTNAAFEASIVGQ